ncbi:hypothetical protein BGX21_007014 [Mortierella sp. AD011]|nr:hypothetical protein BGX20_006904 [Mortierella sp. AD010]KAF9398965.1 hypothetical protein BGX21_007014 [Mortierella sp. AD011]
MAKKKTSARKTARQSALSAHGPYHRSGSSLSNNNSKAPSNASSPSPQPLDLAHGGRRKGVPKRSPSQNDQSKGIVFSFRIQNDSALSMSINIRKYDQQFGPPEDTEPSNSLELKLPVEPAEAEETTASGENSSSMALSLTDGKLTSSSRSSSSGPASPLSSPSELRVGGERWSSDPTAFKSSNVYDQSRNLLILHTRKPPPSGQTSSATSSTSELSQSFHPYRLQRSSDSRSSSSSSLSSIPSTPSLIHSGSSSISSSPTSSPSSPTSLHSPTGDSGSAKDDSCSMDSLPLPLDALGAHSTRFLNVRGMGGATKGRRMQVLVV